MPHARLPRRRYPRTIATARTAARRTPLSSRTDAPAPISRRERRLAERNAHAGGADRQTVAPGHRRGSPLIWVTVAVALVGVVMIAGLLLLQGTAPKSVDVSSLNPPLSYAPIALADGRTLGKADAPVTLEVWSDYQCPACEQFATIVEPALIRTYVQNGTLRIIDHDAAFQGRRSSSAYDESVEAAAGARCAAEQGRYWPFHDWLFANQVGENEGAFRDERLRAIASAAGLDVVAWDACRATGQQQAAARAETTQGTDQGINSTPTMYINGQAIVGLHTAADLGALIDSAVAAPSPS